MMPEQACLLVGTGLLGTWGAHRMPLLLSARLGEMEICWRRSSHALPWGMLSHGLPDPCAAVMSEHL